MKVAYFDCFSGIAGDMILGALVDAGLDAEVLQSEIAKLHVEGLYLSSEKVSRSGIGGTKVHVKFPEQRKHRHLNHIDEIICESDLSDTVQKKCLQVFRSLAEAEARIHNTDINKVHFHEVGALDAIADVTGAVAGLEKLGIERVCSSAISVGQGFVECDHGKMPVPAPATLELLKGVPVRSSGIDAELTTPTGAAIITTIADEFGKMPDLRVLGSGYGAGSRELPIPNLLRLIIGEASEKISSERVILLETNIDDMPPQQYEYVMERLFEAGALDVWFTPIIMKKSRPAIIFSVLTDPGRCAQLERILLRETTTLGVRRRELERTVLRRESKRIQTEYGVVSIKIAELGDGEHKVIPEYEDCAAAARKSGRPFEEIRSDVLRAAENILSNSGQKKDPLN